MQIDIFATCKVCSQQNYRTSKAKKPQGDKLSLKKYCRFCQKTQLHQEQVIKKTKKKR